MMKQAIVQISTVSFSRSDAFLICRSRLANVLTVLLLLAMPLHLSADVTKGGDDKKKKKKVEVIIPEARGSSQTFTEGFPIDIELSAATGSLKRVEFFIRDLPEHGKLTNLRPHPRDNNKAVITYLHNERSGSLTDSFVFACRLDGGPISAPAVVNLTGKANAALIEIVAKPQFSRTFAGSENKAWVSVKNKGTALFQAPLLWKAPWEGPDFVEVAPGQTTDFEVTFRPEAEGVFREEIEIQPGAKESVMQLYGESIQALTISPGRLTLALDEKTGERVGVLTLVNRKEDSISVSFKMPPRIQPLEPVILEPLATVKLDLKLAASDVDQFLGDMQVESEAFKGKVTLDAIAKPAAMKLVEPAGGLLDFGIVKQRTEAKSTITFANVGGQSLVASASIVPPFSLEKSDELIRLEPGQQKKLTVILDTAQAGNIVSHIEVSSATTSVRVDLRGEISAVDAPSPILAANPSKRSTPVVDPAKINLNADGSIKRTGAEATVLAIFASHGVPLPKSAYNRSLEKVDWIQASDITSNKVLLKWNAPKIIPAKWRIDYATFAFAPNSQMMFKSWKPLTTWESSTIAEPGKIVAQIHSLAPSSQYELRIVGVDREGKISEPSTSILFKTLPPWKLSPWFWRILIAAILGGFIYVLKRVQRGDLPFSKEE